MTLLDAIILGLVEGITEFLPVSSTGHLIIASGLLGLTRDPEMKRAADDFAVVIQGGAILAVLGLYWPRVLQCLRSWLPGSLETDKRAAGRRLTINLIVAFIPAAVLGLLLNDYIDAYLFHTGPVLAALALGGVWMIWLDKRRRKRASDPAAPDLDPDTPGRQVELTIDQLTWKRALVIGLLQCIAMWPGTSRSMMTIAGGMMTGLKPRDAAEFSFLLGLPTLGAACLYRLLKNVYQADKDGTPNMFEQLGWANILLGMAVATVSAALAVKWLVGFLNRHGLAPFGWYRLALCLVLGGLVAAGLVEVG